jgi:hypothetical protein
MRGYDLFLMRDLIIGELIISRWFMLIENYRVRFDLVLRYLLNDWLPIVPCFLLHSGGWGWWESFLILISWLHIYHWLAL